MADATDTTGYGQDLSCVFDLDPTCAEVSGNVLLAQALVRRLITERGQLIGDPEYGTDITQYLNDDVGPSDISAMAAAIRAELKKDQRVATVTVQIITPPLLTGTYTIIIGITGAAGPFSMTLAANDTTVDLLKVA